MGNKNEKMRIQAATPENLDEMEKLYDDLNDYCQAGVNYPGWIKDIYPIRETAEIGIQEGNLFILKKDERIAGAVILNHKQEAAYTQADWGIKAKDSQIIVVHTLVVHPDFLKQGVAQSLIEFAKGFAKQQNAKTIRLDVSVKNTPAISLYEKSDFVYVDTVDLGLGYEHLIWFKLYEFEV